MTTLAQEMPFEQSDWCAISVMCTIMVEICIDAVQSQDVHHCPFGHILGTGSSLG